MTNRNLLIAMPVRNESKTLTSVIAEIRSQISDCDILAVEDGSSDDTVAQAKKNGAKVISLPVGLGYGGAIRVAMHAALHRRDEYLITMDGDGQHDAADLRNLLQPLINNTADLTIGSRFAGTAHYPISFSRRLVMLFFARLSSVVTGTKITDSSCGFMAFNHNALRHLANYCADDYPNAELLCIAGLRGLQIKEVPIQVHPRKHGESMFNISSMIYYPIKLFLASGLAVLRHSRG